jgi:hypothetical protein
VSLALVSWCPLDNEPSLRDGYCLRQLSMANRDYVRHFLYSSLILQKVLQFSVKIVYAL